jgi:iron complex outermembrane recepter protein
MKSILSAVIGATLALSAIQAGAQASPGERQVSLTIESTSLATALDKWAQQSGFQIFVHDWEATKNLRAPSLNGTFTAQAALEQLLSGTSFTYEWIDSKTVSVRKRVAKTVPTALQRTSLDGQQAVPVAKFSGDGGTGFGVATAAAAQSDVTATPVGGDKGVRVARLEEVIVTGTNIRGTSATAGQVIVLDRAEIEAGGYRDASDLVAKVPQNFGGGASQTVTSNMSRDGSEFNQGVGTAVNLRGLGAGATLTLLNGNRLAPAGQGTFVDISLIPLSAIERVEILTDGASAIYGSDAIGGVVNIITRRDYEGAETTVRVGSVTSGDRNEYTLAQLFGHSWDRGNLTLNFEHSHEDDLMALDRPDLVAPGGAAPFDILPEQTLNSLLAAVSLDLSPSMRLTSDVVGSDRKFTQLGSPTASPSEGAGHATGGGLSATLQKDLEGGWQLQFIGSYSRNILDKTFRIPSINFKGDSTSEYRTWSGEVRANGELLSLPAGRVKVAAGTTFRDEESDQQTLVGTQLYRARRDITSAYAELLVPMFGNDEAARGARRGLDLSVAGRFDDYSDFGHSTSPRYGLIWYPSERIAARAAYSESFRAPLFSQNRSGSNFAYIADLPDPLSTRPDGLSSTVTYYGQNPELEPEHARSWTAGFEFRPLGTEGLTIALNYFDIQYRDRILDIHAQDAAGFLVAGDVFAPFISRAPGDAALRAVLTPLASVPNGITDFNTGLGVTDVDAILSTYSFGALFDGRFANAAESKVRGIDADVRFNDESSWGSFGVGMNASYLLDFSNRFTETAPTDDVLNTVFHPIDLRLRGFIGLTANQWSASIFVNYTDAYDDPGTSYTLGGSVDSYMTTDFQLRYESMGTAISALNGVTVSLSILNAFDEKPPHIDPLPGQFAFDAENASPLGRFIALGITKRWGSH